MEKALSIAKSEDVKRICGYATQDAIDEFDFLLDWYERLGFVVTEPYGKQIVPAEKMVVRVF